MRRLTPSTQYRFEISPDVWSDLGKIDHQTFRELLVQLEAQTSQRVRPDGPSAPYIEELILHGLRLQCEVDDILGQVVLLSIAGQAPRGLCTASLDVAAEAGSH